MSPGAETAKVLDFPTEAEVREAKKQELLARLLPMLEELEDVGGAAGLELLGEVASGQKTAKELSKELGEVSDFSEFQDSSIDYLEDLGVVEKEEGFLIIDLKKITKDLTPGYLPSTAGDNRDFGRRKAALLKRAKLNIDGELYNRAAKEINNKHNNHHNGDFRGFLFNALKGVKVVSKEEWKAYKKGDQKSDKEPPTPKDLFYNPASVEEAFSVEKIKRSEFLLGLWEVQGPSRDSYSDFHSELPEDEASIACFVYHPKFGDGKRDEQGNLLVKAGGDKYKKITADWLAKESRNYQKTRNKTDGRGQLFRSPHSYLDSGHMPHLVKDGLLLAGDFRSTSVSAEKTSVYPPKPLVNPKGYVMLNDGIRYTLGGEFGGQKNEAGKPRYWVHRISEQLGGVVEVSDSGSKKLQYVFDLVKPGDPNLKMTESSTSSYLSVNKEHIDLRKNNQVGGVNMVEDEKGDLVFELSGGRSMDIDSYTQAKKELALETGVSLDKLSPYSQSVFLDFYNSATPSQKEEIYDFVKIYKEKGVRVFTLLSIEPQSVDLVLSMAAANEIPQVALVFEKLNRFLELAENASKYAKDFYEEDKQFSDDQLVGEEMLRRASRVLKEYAQGELGEDVGQLFLELDKIDEELNIFLASFKATKPELEDVKGIELSSSSVSDLSNEDKADMLEISKANWLGRGSAGEGVVSEFAEALETGQDIRFYILKRDGEVVSFLRFEPVRNERGNIIPGHEYAGSFNVDPNYRGSAIGGAMIEEVLNREAEKFVLEATVHPDITVGTKYVEDTGFAITRVLPNYDNSGVTFFEIICDRKKNDKLATRKMSQQELIDLFKQQELQQELSINRSPDLDDDIIVHRFKCEEEKEAILSTVNQLTGEGYLGSRYFIDPDDKDYRYYIFERDLDENKGE